MKVKLECPYAHHGELMRVYCKDDTLCPFQYFRNCKGWWVNSPNASECKIRKEVKK